MSTVIENENARTECCAGNCEQPSAGLRPRVTISEVKDAYRIEAEMPGVTRDTLKVQLDKDVLTLAGQKPARAVDGRVLHREALAGEYRRQFSLGREVDRSRISATVAHGVVTVTLPKVEEVKPRFIEVQ